MDGWRLEYCQRGKTRSLSPFFSPLFCLGLPFGFFFHFMSGTISLSGHEKYAREKKKVKVKGKNEKR
jgi:hypothetical protein